MKNSVDTVNNVAMKRITAETKEWQLDTVVTLSIVHVLRNESLVPFPRCGYRRFFVDSYLIAYKSMSGGTLMKEWRQSLVPCDHIKNCGERHYFDTVWCCCSWSVLTAQSRIKAIVCSIHCAIHWLNERNNELNCIQGMRMYLHVSRWRSNPSYVRVSWDVSTKWQSTSHYFNVPRTR